MKMFLLQAIASGLVGWHLAGDVQTVRVRFQSLLRFSDPMERRRAYALMWAKRLGFCAVIIAAIWWPR